jgi:predicted aspartyl protease
LRKRQRELDRAKAVNHLRGKVINGRECQFKLLVGRPSMPDNAAGALPITAIIDTGCTHSAICRDLATKLQLPVTGTTKVISVNQVFTTDVVTAKLIIPGGRGNDAVGTFVQLSLADLQGEMLFGMDLLNGGILTVNMVDGTWDWKLLAVGPHP